ncbi:TetR/AcrR family transcriptional regulator [Amycolatopsis pittospori]|uniref:TetR/AcrR family transcriptional regulator n=1 Tax=Amycolatopsis pittospori TaxID=2749434 RepID=UPI0015F026AF|nr:TetR/AcrR family transcriptional regulator [Amycolatopsis pittospori]
MARPRVHDLERLLDVAERLVVDVGPRGVTVRSLAVAAGVPNGTIYHAFGSLGALLARVWLRAATDFLAFQTELTDQEEDPVEATVAAADAPAAFAGRRPAAARLLLTVKKEQLLGPQVPDDLAGALLALDKRLVALLIRLAARLWDRHDAQAVEVLTTCVVDLPTALFRRALTVGEPISEDSRVRLATAVRAVLLLPPSRKD